MNTFSLKIVTPDGLCYEGQADPFILESNGKFYIYTTGSDGIYAYSSDDVKPDLTFGQIIRRVIKSISAVAVHVIG